MSAGRLVVAALLVGLLAVPFLPMHGMKQYVLHVLIQIFIWAFIGGAWSLMGRFGLVSLGHGAFLGLGAYTTTLLWNFFGLTPWLGALVAVALTAVLAVVVAYPCSRFSVIGHYFGLVTLAVGEVIRLLIIAERDWTGGSLGLTVRPEGGDSLVAVQFADKRVFYYAGLVLWALGLWVWHRLDRSMARSAMEAIGEDETAAASVGIHVTRFKIGITVLSAILTAVGGRVAAHRVRGRAGRHVRAARSHRRHRADDRAGRGAARGVRCQLRRHGRDDLRAVAHHLHHLPALGDLRQRP